MILSNVQIRYTKLDPKRPNATFNKDAPTWELQIYTDSKAVAQEWKDKKLNVKMKEENDKIVYVSTLKKKSKKKDKQSGQMVDAVPVKVVDGHLNAIDPNTLGNGSVANIRVFQYEYDSAGVTKTANMLMDVQIVKHVVYVPKNRDDEFAMTETERVVPAEQFGDNDDSDGDF